MHIKKNTMAKVVNQNDIIEIVKSTISLLDDITGLISNSLNIFSSIKHQSQNFQDALYITFGRDGNGGIIGSINTISDNLTSSPKSFKRRLLMKGVRRQLREVKSVFKIIDELTEMSSKIDLYAVKNLSMVVNTVYSLFQLIENFPINPIIAIRLELSRGILLLFQRCIINPIRYLGLYLMRRARAMVKGMIALELLKNYYIPTVYNLIEYIASLPLSKYIKALISIWAMKQILIKTINGVFEISDLVIEKINEYGLYDILTIISGMYIMRMMDKIFTYLYHIICGAEPFKTLIIALMEFWSEILPTVIQGIMDCLKIIVEECELYNIKQLFNSLIKMMLISGIFFFLNQIFKSKDVLGTLISWKFNIWDKILTGTQKMFDILHEITSHKYKIKNLIKTSIRMFFIMEIFKMLQIVMKSAMWAAISAYFFNKVALGLELAINSIFDLLKLIRRKIRRIKSTIVSDILKLVAIISLLGLVAISLFIVTLLAIPVILGLPIILGFILALVPIILIIYLIALAGIAFGILGPLALPGLFSLVLAITALGFMAAQLYLISKIDLDRDAVLNTVDTILTVCHAIMNKIFGDVETDRFDIEDNGSWWDLFKTVTTGAPEIIKALSASLILLITFISVVFIFLIAGILMSLQKFIKQLDKSSILESINEIIGICRFINSAVFNTKEYDKTNQVVKDTKESDKNLIARFFSGFSDIITACSAAVLLIPTMISVSALWFIGNTLKEFTNIDIGDEAEIKTKIRDIMGCVKTLIAAIREPAPDQTQDREKDGWIGKMAKAILPSSLLDTIDAFLSMPMLLFAWVSITMLKTIVDGLLKINDLPKLDNIESNTRLIISTIKNIITHINESGLKITDDNMEFARKSKKIIKRLISIANIDLSKIAEFEKNIPNLESVIEKITSVLTNNLPKFVKIKRLDDIKKNLSYIKNIFKEMSNMGEIQILDNASWGTDENASPIEKCLDGIDRIVKRLSKSYLRKGKFKRMSKRLTRYADLLSIMTNMASSHLSEFRGQDLNAHEKFMKNNIKFLQQIEKTDLSKIKQTTRLFQKMAEFSQSINGNFEGLADTLNEKIAPLLEELKERMEGLGNKVEKSGSDISASVFASNNPNATNEEMIAQVNRENPNATAAENAKLAQRRMEQQAQRQTESLIAKFDELISLFRSGQYSEARY